MKKTAPYWGGDLPDNEDIEGGGQGAGKNWEEKRQEYVGAAWLAGKHFLLWDQRYGIPGPLLLPSVSQWLAAGVWLSHPFSMFSSACGI